MKSTNNYKQQLTQSFELSVAERLELKTLRQENDILKKTRAELAVKNRRDKYEGDAMLRKLQKQIEKLKSETNALKVILSETPLNEQSLTSLPLRVKQRWQNKHTFSTTG